MVYLGKQGKPERNLGMKVVNRLTRDLVDAGRTVVCDNFFTSLELGQNLWQKKTFLLGTVRSNRQGLPKDFVNEELAEKKARYVYNKYQTLMKLNKVCAPLLHFPSPLHQSSSTQFDLTASLSGKRAINWHQLERCLRNSWPTAMRTTSLENSSLWMRRWWVSKSKSVLLYSTFHQRPAFNKRAEKPQIVADYDKTKCGVDQFDEMTKHFSFSPATRRRPVKIMQWLVNVAAMNAWVLYQKQNKSFKVPNTFI